MATKKPFGFTIKGGKELEKQLKTAGPMVVRAAAQSLYDSCGVVMSVSKEKYVPVVTGTLRSSGTVEMTGFNLSKGAIKITMGFGGPAAPYALAVHENPRSGKTKGLSPDGKRHYKTWSKVGQWKYLETPLKALRNDISEQLRHDVDRALARL